MPDLPVLDARKVIKALKQAGFIEDRQKGSHLVMLQPEINARMVVPVHAGRDIKKPLLRAIIKDAGLTTEEFLKLL